MLNCCVTRFYISMQISVLMFRTLCFVQIQLEGPCFGIILPKVAFLKLVSKPLCTTHTLGRVTETKT